MKKLNSIQFYGMPLPIYAFFAIIVLACAYFNIIPNQMIGAVAVLFAFGILIGEIGERLPIWNKFLGGGAMLCFLAAGLLKYFNLLPECVTNVSDGWINGYSFLNVFITFLVVGSLLGIDRDVLIKSGSLYIPTLLCSLLGACVFGVVAGLIFGNDPLYLITSYVLPIMGGGAGAGAVPMAQVYSDATGQDSAGYLSFCMAILALGNIVAILMAVVMDLIGRAFPKMTGHGELLRVKNKSLEVESKNPAPAVTVDDIAAAIFICAGFFMLGQLVSKKILPTVFGVAIPNFAYMIIFAALANIFNLIPENLRKACRRCQHFCGNKLVWIQMVGMGISAINFSTMFSVASWQNVVIVLMIVIGCCVGSALFGLIEASVYTEGSTDFFSKSRSHQTVRCILHTFFCSGDISAKRCKSATRIFNQRTDNHICSEIRRFCHVNEFPIAVIDHYDNIAADAFNKVDGFPDVCHTQGRTRKISLGPLDFD